MPRALTVPIEAEAITARAVLSFALALVPLFALFVWLYPRIAPTWSGWVAVGANAGYRAWSVPLEVRAESAGETLSAYVTSPSGSDLLVTDHTPENVFLGLILLPALLLATPLEVGKRARLLVVGLALLYLVHALCIGVLFHELLRLRQGHAGPVSNWLLASILTSGQMSSVVLWALLTGGYWFPRKPVARNAACPCGSGRKYKRCCGAAPAEARTA